MPLDVEKLIEQNIADGAEIEISGAVDAATIRAAETLLGVRFPRSYREYLAQYGALEIDGRTFAGLGTDAPRSGDVVAFTRYARRDYTLADHYVALDFQDSDFWMCLDTSRRDANDESPVVLIHPVDGTQSGPDVAPSWADYLVEYLSA